MKVLTIKQPYADLIGQGIKKYEIRSRKINYRGELYIHSSLSKIKEDSRKKQFLKYFKNDNIDYGYILYKCNLVDCVYIDEDFLKTMQKGSIENLYNEDFIGSYAWVISDVVLLDKKIRAKGNLGIWNYYEENK